MPRVLTVSQIRQVLYQAAGCSERTGPGRPSLPLLGQLFHETFAALTGPDEQRNLVRPLATADASLESWRRHLTDYAYLWHVGPQLVRHQATLREATPEVMTYWEAIRHLCAWLVEVLWHQRRPGQSLATLRAQIFFRHEEELLAELTDPAWRDTVVIQGRGDAVLRQPATGALCLVELKLGRTTPEVDLCQACLYHLLFQETLDRHQAGAPELALLAFEPERREHRFTASQLREAQAQLRALIGRLAGVIGLSSPPPSCRYRELGQRVVGAFAEFGARLRLESEPLVGPAFIRFFAVPERGVRVRQVVGISESVWTRLQTV